ncbi:unnamed protein product [Amoebophrya sp. A25]|nr:unnamed protein product [Amoebophrya sp. A25]|eukprot:GSA25T00009807001.1
MEEHRNANGGLNYETRFFVKLKIFHPTGPGSKNTGRLAAPRVPAGGQNTSVEVIELGIESYEELCNFVREHLQDDHLEWQLLSSANVPFTDDMLYL